MKNLGGGEKAVIFSYLVQDFSAFLTMNSSVSWLLLVTQVPTSSVDASNIRKEASAQLPQWALS
jgi:hypothetical protein